MSVTLLPASGHRQVQWKNGGGVTTELVLRPDGASAATFDWRLSIATVGRDGAFSVFPGVDRSLMALSPQGLGLVDNGHQVNLHQYGVHRFAGENEVAAVGVTAPTLDLNLMTRRAAFTGELHYVDLADEQVIGTASGTAVVVMLSGSLSFRGQLLRPHDSVLIENGQADFVGEAGVAVATLFCASGCR
ncbi:HutD family protein [Arthrobacter sp. H20]|uniref:HutD/Ves family protein n=1 Tax=Arthrobacter sp. H20 TaxID=1267981 RepID=UPI00068696C2|nr:HutD family protein [Arthrobacter sp. H20]